MKSDARDGAERTKLLRRFHTLCALNGLTVEQKRALVGGYGFASSADMPPERLLNACTVLQRQLDRRARAAGDAGRDAVAGGRPADCGGRAQEMDRLRKRCLKALCRYLDVRGAAPADKIGYAKGIACRAARKTTFNRLTAAQLRAVTAYFNQERETLERAAHQAAWETALRAMRPVGEA